MEEVNDEFSARGDAGPSSSRSTMRSETAEIFTTSEEQNRITIIACKQFEKARRLRFRTDQSFTRAQ